MARRLTADQSVRFASILAFMTAVGGGATHASVEDNHVSTWDGVWWAVSTMTTVGYGGIGFIAIVTAAIAQRFVVGGVATEIEHTKAETEHDLQATEAHVIGELRELQRRLRDLEVAGTRITQRPQPPEAR